MVSIIVAVAQNGVIGDKNALLWHISEDMRFFRRTTSGHPVIMGRKTYDSLGRPLPNRTNVVISRTTKEIEGCTVVGSLEEAIALFPKEEEIFIIGGAQIYALALEVADRLYLTRVFPHSQSGIKRSGSSPLRMHTHVARNSHIHFHSRPTKEDN